MPVLWQRNNSCDPHEKRKGGVLHLVAKYLLNSRENRGGKVALLRHSSIASDLLKIIGIDTYRPIRNGPVPNREVSPL